MERTEPHPAFEKIQGNFKRIEELNRRFLAAIAKRKPPNPKLFSPSQEFLANTMQAYFGQMAGNPEKVLKDATRFWSDSANLWLEAQKSIVARTGVSQAAGAEGAENGDSTAGEALSTHPYFDIVQDQYQLNSELLSRTLGGLEGLTEEEDTQLKFFAQQIIDMMSPSNFLATNPEALAKAISTEGESLIRGMENLVRDLEANDGELIVTLADPDAFRIGENIATSSGSVVFRNDLIELIQYAPTTEKVYTTPIILFPPWINKYYILDLKPSNSFVRWIVEQGYTLFVASWINPDKSLRDKGLDAYAREGYLDAIDSACEITGQKQVNAIGYCIGGTMLAMVLSYLKKIGDKRVKGATFLATLTDFADPGEVGVYLSEQMLEGLREEMRKDGVMSSRFMSQAFSYLRARDLVYRPAVRSYMLGETPPAFDLIYWNGDSTNLTERMANEYLGGLYGSNDYLNGDQVLLGDRISIRDVELPIFAVACESDHIAKWKASFAGIKAMGSGSKTFVLSRSGHIAGIVNPPEKNKYGYLTNQDLAGDADSWLQHSEVNEGSWWPVWNQWQAKRSGPKVAARRVGSKSLRPLCPAPGLYVHGKP